MTDLFITLYALFILWFMGINFMLATGLRQSDNPFLANLASEFCIGAGLLYLLLLTGTFITGSLSPIIVYTVLFILIIFNLLTSGKVHLKQIHFLHKKEAAGFLLTLSLLFLLFLPSIEKGLEWDAWAIWAFKAKAFYLDGKIDSLFLSDMDRYAYSHPDYPLLFPLVKYWIYFHLGHVNDHVIRLVPLAFWTFMLLFFYTTLLGRIKTKIALLTLALLSLIWPVTQNVLMSSADAIQAFYNLLGIIYLYKWIEKSEKADFWTGSIILAMGMNVKNEGFAFWVSTALVLLILSTVKIIQKDSNRQLKAFIRFSLTGLFISLLWIIDKKLMSIGSELFSKEIPSLGIILERSGDLSLFYLKQILNTGYSGWGFLWLFTALALFKMVACGDVKKEHFQLYLASCFIHMLVLFAIYCITPYEINYHIQTSGDRTLLQLAPAIFWISTVSLFSDQNKENKLNNSL